MSFPRTPPDVPEFGCQFPFRHKNDVQTSLNGPMWYPEAAFCNSNTHTLQLCLPCPQTTIPASVTHETVVGRPCGNFVSSSENTTIPLYENTRAYSQGSVGYARGAVHPTLPYHTPPYPILVSIIRSDDTHFGCHCSDVWLLAIALLVPAESPFILSLHRVVPHSDNTECQHLNCEAMCISATQPRW